MSRVLDRTVAAILVAMVCGYEARGWYNQRPDCVVRVGPGTVEDQAIEDLVDCLMERDLASR